MDTEQQIGSKLAKEYIKEIFYHLAYLIYMQSESESEVPQSCPTLCDPWTVAHQAPPSMGFSRQEYWIGLPFPSPGDLPDPGIEPRSPTLQADALTSAPPGKPLYAEYIIRNAGEEEVQAGIKIAGRNINKLRYADDTNLMADSKEELKSLLMKVIEESEKSGLKSAFKKLRSWHPVPSLHGK